MFFQPWIGRNYKSAGFNGCRVLILGESHYQAQEKLSPSFTIDCVMHMAKGAKGHSFFTKVAKLFLDFPKGVPIPQEQRVAFWDSVAFYNYVQEFAGNQARKRPTREMWANAVKAFPPVHADLDPMLTLVLGRALEARLPSHPPLSQYFLQIEHPSSFGFQPDLRRPMVQQMVQLVGGT